MQDLALPEIQKYEVPDIRTLAWLICSDEFVMQEKIDGRRLIVIVNDSKIVGYNKTYDLQNLPKWLMRDLERLTGGPWVFDGEITNEAYYVFDVTTTAKGRMTNMPFVQRSTLLHSMVHAWDPDRVRTLKVWNEPATKVGHLLALQAREAEGVVFKPGDETTAAAATYKHKFYKSVDCIVLERRKDGKRACEIGLMKDGQFVNIGKVKAEYDIQDRMTADQVIEVRYRSLSKNNRLIEPVLIRLRNDKKAYSCTFEQIEHASPKLFKGDLLDIMIEETLGVSADEIMQMIAPSLVDEDPQVIEIIKAQLL